LNEKTRKEAVEWLLKRDAHPTIWYCDRGEIILTKEDAHYVLDGIELILRILLEKENL